MNFIVALLITSWSSAEAARIAADEHVAVTARWRQRDHEIGRTKPLIELLRQLAQGTPLTDELGHRVFGHIMFRASSPEVSDNLGDLVAAYARDLTEADRATLRERSDAIIARLFVNDAPEYRRFARAQRWWGLHKLKLAVARARGGPEAETPLPGGEGASAHLRSAYLVQFERLLRGELNCESFFEI